MSRYALCDYVAANPYLNPHDPGVVGTTAIRDAVVDFWKDNAARVPLRQRYVGTVTRTASAAPCKLAQITDGTSNTLTVSECRLQVSLYNSGSWHDWIGWTAGWSLTTIRSTAFSPEPDDSAYSGPTFIDATYADLGRLPDEHLKLGHQFGSAHTTGINAVFADGHVVMLDYGIDHDVFNRMGDRRDGTSLSHE